MRFEVVLVFGVIMGVALAQVNPYRPVLAAARQLTPGILEDDRAPPCLKEDQQCNEKMYEAGQEQWLDSCCRDIPQCCKAVPTPEQ